MDHRAGQSNYISKTGNQSGGSIMRCTERGGQGGEQPEGGPVSRGQSTDHRSSLTSGIRLELIRLEQPGCNRYYVARYAVVGAAMTPGSLVALITSHHTQNWFGIYDAANKIKDRITGVPMYISSVTYYILSMFS